MISLVLISIRWKLHRLSYFLWKSEIDSTGRLMLFKDRNGGRGVQQRVL